LNQEVDMNDRFVDIQELFNEFNERRLALLN